METLRPRRFFFCSPSNGTISSNSLSPRTSIRYNPPRNQLHRFPSPSKDTQEHPSHPRCQQTRNPERNRAPFWPPRASPKNTRLNYPKQSHTYRTLELFSEPFPEPLNRSLFPIPNCAPLPTKRPLSFGTSRWLGSGPLCFGLGR